MGDLIGGQAAPRAVSEIRTPEQTVTTSDTRLQSASAPKWSNSTSSRSAGLRGAGMKYDLLFSDVIASIAGLFGFLAAAISLQKAMFQWMGGDPSTAGHLVVLALLLFLLSRCFLSSKPYQKMLVLAQRMWLRIPFILVCLLWLLAISIVFNETAPQNLFRIPSLIPWLFTIEAVLLLTLPFLLVFFLPGYAFRHSGVTSSTPGVDVAAEEDHSPPVEQVLSNEDATAVKTFSEYPRWVRWPISAWLYFVLLPALVSIFTNFLTSGEWLASVYWVAIISGALTAVCFAWFGLMSLRLKNKSGLWMKTVTLTCVSALGFYIGNIGAAAAFPILRALAAGTDTQIVFIVKEAGGYQNKCSNPITVESGFVLANRLCGFSYDVVHELRPGDQIMVFGKGTSDGLFVQKVLRVTP